MRGDGGDGADPDAFVYPHHVPTLNEYFPSIQSTWRWHGTNSPATLRRCGRSASARSSHGRGSFRESVEASALRQRRLRQNLRCRFTGSSLSPGGTPLMSQCGTPRIVAFGNELGACDLFFGDVMPGAIRPIVAPTDSIDPQTAWIDARLAFAESPSLAQAIGGALTQSAAPLAGRAELMAARLRARLALRRRPNARAQSWRVSLVARACATSSRYAAPGYASSWRKARSARLRGRRRRPRFTRCNFTRSRRGSTSSIGEPVVAATALLALQRTVRSGLDRVCVAPYAATRPRGYIGKRLVSRPDVPKRRARAGDRSRCSSLPKLSEPSACFIY